MQPTCPLVTLSGHLRPLEASTFTDQHREGGNLTRLLILTSILTNRVLSSK